MSGKNAKKAPLNQSPQSQDLVYRAIRHQPEFLVFASREEAYYVHQISLAVEQAKTWDQFRSMLPPGEWQRLQNLFDDEPDGSGSFRAEALPGYSDGDYPPWLQTKIGRYLPAAVLAECCTKSESVINGSFWQIPLEKEAVLVARLRSLGYSVERKDDWSFF